jgi:four helix bundle protein
MMRIELENRLIHLAQGISELCYNLEKSYLAYHLTKQIIRSSTSAALNYGEAQSAETKKDFAHKVGILLKELRETQINLRLLKSSIKENDKKRYEVYTDECNQLIAIFHKTVITTRKNIGN